MEYKKIFIDIRERKFIEEKVVYRHSAKVAFRGDLRRWHLENVGTVESHS